MFSSRGALPIATAILRSQLSWPMRRIAEPSVRDRNSASSHANRFDERCRVEPVARLEIRLDGFLRELVPRAHELAIVAAVDAVADQRAQFDGNAAAQFDGQIGDAAPRIELVRRDDRLRRTDVDAARAGAAVRRSAASSTGSGRSV